EKEVIVYRDKEVGFRPNGYVDLQYRWYGETEGQEESFDTREDVTEGNGNWNGNNNYSRIQLQGKINMTEKQSLEYRIRNYNSTSTHDNGKDGTDTRLRYFYNHGNLGDSKVNFTSRVHYRDREDVAGAQEVEYQARFNFAEYMFNNDFIKTTNFVVAPKYKYVWNKNNDNYDNRIGFDIASFHELPYGFSFELNVYADQHFYGKDQFFDGTNKIDDKNFTISVEAYLYNTQNLYTSADGKVSVDFNFEGGYDTYEWSANRKYGTPHRDGGRYEDKYAINDPVGARLKGVGTEKESYSLYALPTLQVNYQATPSVKVYAAAGAEYRDWAVDSKSSATNWRWQPTVFAGFKTTF
ncbi:major outer membrane protein FomA, partial [Fusobacterium varium]|uniref:major outer membrane protein FomA n=1 Tax=Fusobacterium varium TaxID=856 RepID=UPI00241F05DA